MKHLCILISLFLVGCIPPYTWNVIRETQLQAYDSACVRGAILEVDGVIGAVSTLPSQSYSLTGKPLPRYRQFLIETEFGIAHLNVSNTAGRVDINASFSGYEEIPDGIETMGAQILSSIISSIEQRCGNGI